MDPLGFEANEADFNVNLPTMDDAGLSLVTIRSSASIRATIVKRAYGAGR
jgi:hypothetical protein